MLLAKQTVQILRSIHEVLLDVKVTNSIQCVVILRYLVVENCTAGVLASNAELWKFWIAFAFYAPGHVIIWDRGSTVVKVLCYKSEGTWFDPGFPIALKPWRRLSL